MSWRRKWRDGQMTDDRTGRQKEWIWRICRLLLIHSLSKLVLIKMLCGAWERFQSQTEKDQTGTTAAPGASSWSLHQTHRRAELEKDRRICSGRGVDTAAPSRGFRGQCSGSWDACFRPACPPFWRAAPASFCDPQVQFRSLSFSMSRPLKLRGETQNPRYLFYVFQTEITNSASAASAAAHNWWIHPHLLQWFGTHIILLCDTLYVSNCNLVYLRG